MNQNLDKKKERFQRDGIPTRLGNLAANLSRIKSFSNNRDNKEIVKVLIHESMWFIEWVAPEMEVEFAEELVNIQRQLGRWLRNFETLWVLDEERSNIIGQASNLSQRLLDMSGLLPEVAS
jgi:hypothetical protein